MPRRYHSSSRYLRETSAERAAERERLTNGDIAKIEPLTSAPDYISITWLASKIGIYGEAHPSAAATAMKGTFFIGQGATFAVYRANYGDKVYAVKQPRLVFERGQDESDTMRQLYSLHLELRVLADQRVRAHGNIAKLVMILWEEHPDDLGRHWPSMVMEYADLGTLATCYEHGLQLGLESEKLLCFGIGDALSFLHENSVIHGDVKPENILMFSGSSPGALIPKLSDFGFSVLDRNNTPRLPGGTPDWEAPEVLEKQAFGNDLVHSDTYSFGLLVWYISRNGTAPFASLDGVLIDLESEGAREVIGSLKKTAHIPEIAGNSLERDKRSYSNIFDLTLCREPQRRDLKSALISLGVGFSAEEFQSTNIADLSHRTQNSKGLNAGQFNIREFRHLGHRIQAQLIDSLVARTSPQSGCNEVQRSETAMALSQICLECLGGKKQGQALEWLELAAGLGHPIAKSVIYRVSKALGCYKEGENAILSYLIESAEAGILIAMEDLMEANSKRGEAVLQALKEKRYVQCLPEISVDSPLTDLPGALTITDEMGDLVLHRAARCGDISVTRKIIQINHEDGQSLLDSQNKLGQTPLLLACVAGEFSTSEILLKAGASAAIPDKEGDTPLHWLHAFEKSSIPLIAASLMDRGASIHAYSSRNEKDAFSQKVLAAGTPLHRAAAWNNGEAVRVLLDHGADPLRPNSGRGWHELSTPLWLACTFHNGEAVRAILLHLGKTKDIASIVNDGERREWPFLMPAFDLGYYYSHGGMLGRIARHGELYTRATEDTIQALKSHGARMLLPGASHRLDIPGQPALTSAILLRCTDIVKIMLHVSPESVEQWDPKFMQPPLHFAAQQDRADIVELLLSSGADAHARNGNGINALANYTNYQSGLEIPRLLIKHGVRYELSSNGFQTPFFGAVTHGSFELADFVLKNTECKDLNKMINASCSRGPTFTTDPPGITILGYLLEICHQSLPIVLRRLFDLVRKFGENVDVIVDPGQGRTAFHVLAQLKPRARMDPVVAAVAKEIMHQCSVDDCLNLVSKKGKSALWYAVKHLNYDLIDCLLDAGANPNVVDHQGLSTLDLLRNQVVHTREHHGGKREQVVLESLVKLFRSYGYTLDEIA